MTEHEKEKCNCGTCHEEEESHEEKGTCSCGTCHDEVECHEDHEETECQVCRIEPEGKGPLRETGFKIDNMDCADCAKKLEERIAKVHGVTSVKFNFGTATLNIKHTGAASDLLDVVEQSGYHVAADTFKITQFDVQELDCIDCAKKFEKAIAMTPGVIRASLNFAVGKLIVEHTCPVDDILAAARDIGYTIKVSGTKEKGSFFTRHRPVLITVVSGLLTVTGFTLSHLNVPPYIPILLYFMAIVVGGSHIAKSAIYSLKTMTADMNLLMTIAIIGAMAIGQWEEGATVVVLFALGNALQSYTLDKTRNSIKELISITPNDAAVIRNGSEVRLNTALINVGDMIVVKPGEKIPMDGEVISGLSYVNQAPITGESMSVEKEPGSVVYAGTINENGALEIKVTRLAKDNTLSKIIHMVEEAQVQRAPTQVFLDKFTKYYTPAVILLAAGVAIIPTLMGQPFYTWLYRGLVLLVISCPCALVISTPVSIVAAIGSASRNGVLIKGGSYLEEIGRARAIAFDKTGTLTKGKTAVSEVVNFDSLDTAQIMNIAASLESKSGHPLAAAIIRANHGQTPMPVENFQSVTGKGVTGTVDGVDYTLGNLKMFEAVNENVQQTVAHLQEAGMTPVILGKDHAILAVIAISDEVRPESRELVKDLHKSGLKEVVMLTGDNNRMAKAIASDIGLDGYFGELLPEEKANIVKGIRKAHGNVIMVGDGVNDAPALAASNVGIAMGATGSDTALETADIALMANDLTKVDYTIRLGRHTLSIIKQNVIFAIAIKAVFIGLAVFGMANLWMAVFADMGASLIVILNGMRLIRTH
ncbi:cadmium-transporting ATPase [Methanocella paludicola SANAE]|uniref:Cadmium-transporting ATPase n=1 Tax=Methanocella paludicola (strain DSM 17711 / JCM 13418 / NBRC 101707 / SANAE) TaxID=304371 RepID=D1YYC0_METPS|nr:heavy metal translocating P-type ATPase [Methanocella paludicola]BAI61442.1 cadmium-transporting ATPase [Methanocella paludicola SANAE]